MEQTTTFSDIAAFQTRRLGVGSGEGLREGGAVAGVMLGTGENDSLNGGGGKKDLCKVGGGKKDTTKNCELP